MSNFVPFVLMLKRLWIPGSSPRMTTLTACFCSSFPQVLGGNPVRIMVISTFLRMNRNFYNTKKHDL